jgi:hypothetical protein
LILEFAVVERLLDLLRAVRRAEKWRDGFTERLQRVQCVSHRKPGVAWINRHKHVVERAATLGSRIEVAVVEETAP